ncbi:MAG: PIN domain-containing protein [Gammaproteobacteria bacterium]|nr:MAG: PIN domain-containing protein [Gammaproteobacteria bacterium]
MIHLDTSFLIRGLVRGSAEDRALRKWLRDGESLGMSTVAWTELLCGPLEAGRLEFAARVVSQRVPFLEEDSVTSARLFNETGRRRGSLIDCMIAASALRAREPLATANVGDFRRFAAFGLAVLEA